VAAVAVALAVGVVLVDDELLALRGAKPRASLPGCSSSKSQPTFGVECPSPGVRARSFTYALISTDDAAIGLASGAPRTRIPYSVSIPRTFRSAIVAKLPPNWVRA
jgi:hypothetical protein